MGSARRESLNIWTRHLWRACDYGLRGHRTCCCTSRGVNDPETRRQSLRTHDITLEEHREWFDARLGSDRSKLFVLEARQLPVGQIRFDREGTEVRIDYSVDPAFRGRGWAKHLVALGLQHFRDPQRTVFRADIKESNRPSRAVWLWNAHTSVGEPLTRAGLELGYELRFSRARKDHGA